MGKISTGKFFSIIVKDFNLTHTLACGQFFRYKSVDGWYYIHSGNEFFRVRQRENYLEFSGADRDFIEHFFSLDVDLKSTLAAIPHDAYICEAFSLYHGLRLIRQDPWECLLSYLCSIASNIPKIQRCLDGLAMTYGKEVGLGEVKGHSLPVPNRLDGKKILREIGLGFRSQYIYETSRVVDYPFLESLKTMPYGEAKRRLMELPGVGDKVADCVLLFSLDFMEAFPVDRWIERAMRAFYFNGKKTSPKRIQSFAMDYFGKYAGYAQQYLYHYSRTTLGRKFLSR